MKRILNLGAGTQSSVLLLMADRGEIDPVDVAIFADTGWEPKEVYEQLEWLKSEVKNTEIVTVSNGNIYEDAMRFQVRGKVDGDGGRWASMPYFVKTPDSEKLQQIIDQRKAEGKETSKLERDLNHLLRTGIITPGKIRRQCTKEYKIDPIEKYIKRVILGISKGKRLPKEPVIEQVFGISFDERQRMRKSTSKWAKFSYPLIDMGWRRQRVIQWAEENYPGKTFPRSACIGCPFHSNEEWQKTKEGPQDEWQSVVELDKAIRNADGMNGEVYLHRSLLPIDQIDFRSRDEKNGQMSFLDECEGMCGT